VGVRCPQAWSTELTDPQVERGGNPDPRRASEERFYRAFAYAPFGMVMVGADSIVLEANEAFADMIGLGVDDIVGTNEIEHMIDDDPAQVLEWTSGGEPDLIVSDRRYRHADGRTIFTRCTIRMERNGDGRLDGQFVHVADLTRLRQTEDALATSEARFRRAFDEAPIGMALGSTDGRLMWVNDAFCTLLGRPWAEVVGRPGTDFVHADDLAQVGELVSSGHVVGNLGERPVIRLVRPDGTVVWGQISLSRLTGDGPDPEANPLVLAQLVDVSAAHEAEERLAHQATHDALTGLPNRTLLLDRLAQAMRRRVRRGGEVVVLFLDLDDFKVINDGLGHAAGDEVLVESARRLRHCVRPSDTVARLGGDEFVMVCELDRPHEVAALCDRVLSALTMPIRVAGRTLVTSGSLGVVIATDDQEPPDLLRDADVAMYRSKADGRGRSTLFTASLRAEAVTRLEQEASLRQAIEEGELEVHYQPLIDATSGIVAGAEALVRWRHPTLGLLAPKEFLPAAERSGLVSDLGRAVLAQACMSLATWQSMGHSLRVSVNLAPRQLLDDDLVDTVMWACRAAGADPPGLVIEITENALIETLGVASSRLRELRGLGVGVALDDFGTGYSSLQYLKDLPVDLVKIDRSFVTGLGDGDDGALADAMIGLADALGLLSVAEGVERPDQLERLQAMGCAMVQGYLLGRPAPAHEMDLSPRW
jgi:diguanylate cyclase (GGDEF)-like protein/PAS domain S-box-containing protein